jgi:hypothetical protein
LRVASFIVVFLLCILASFCSFSFDEAGARDDLLERYRSVEVIARDHLQISCTRDKGRQRYSFQATRQDGSKVTGYICYTGRLDPFGSRIHENG